MTARPGNTGTDHDTSSLSGLQTAGGSSVIRILIAEDMNMVRGALVALLNLQADLEVVCEVGRGDEVVEMALKHRPDVAIIDIDLPGCDGLSAATQLRERLPQCGALILTSLGRPGTLRRALEARVSGYLLKDAPSAELATAVRRVAAGHRAFDPELALAAWGEFENPSPTGRPRFCGSRRKGLRHGRSPPCCGCRRGRCATI